MNTFEHFQEWLREHHRGVHLLPWQASFARSHLDDGIPKEQLLQHIPMAAGKHTILSLLESYVRN